MKRKKKNPLLEIFTYVFIFAFIYVVQFNYTEWDPLNVRGWFSSAPHEYYDPQDEIQEEVYVEKETSDDIMKRMIRESDITIPDLKRYRDSLASIGKDTIEISGITGTYYNPVAEQCDGSPLVTADGSKIDLEKLKNGEIKWVALSRDLLSRWGGPFSHGDTIEVYHRNTAVSGTWVVHDVMNARAKQKIDFLVALGNKFPGKTRDITIKKEI